MQRKYKLLRKYSNALFLGLRFSALKGRFCGPKVLINCLPKSGTHLVEQVLLQMPYMRRKLRPTLSSGAGNLYILSQLSAIRKGEFVVSHLPAHENILQVLAQNNIKYLMMIRDPRDIVVSHFNYVTYIDKSHPSHSYFASLPDDDARLMAVIEGVAGVVEPIRKVLETYQPWLTADGVHVVRFEHLIGERGGGNDQLQRQAVIDIAQYLGIRIDARQLKRICWGAYSENALTFRKSQLGNWQQVFKPAHNEAFLRVAGEFMEQFGYI